MNESLSTNYRLRENCVAQHSVRVTIKRNEHEPKPDNEVCIVCVHLYVCVFMLKPQILVLHISRQTDVLIIQVRDG